MTCKLLQHGELPAILEQQLSTCGALIATHNTPAHKLTPLLPRFTCLITNGETRIDAQLMDTLPALNHIAVFGVGYEKVDVAAACAREIALSHTPDVLTDDVADMAIGLMLASARQIVGGQKFIESGKWHEGRYPLTTRISGSRLGLLGLGRIGQAIAMRAEALNMAIGFTDPGAQITRPWIRYPDLASLAHNSDILMVCVPGGAGTCGLVNAHILAALGPGGILVNISRGSVVDEKALIHALETGVIAGAGLDVFMDEPKVPQALHGRDNIVITPHMASATRQTRVEMSGLVMDNVRAGLAGTALITPVPESPRYVVQKMCPRHDKL